MDAGTEGVSDFLVKAQQEYIGKLGPTGTTSSYSFRLVCYDGGLAGLELVLHKLAVQKYVQEVTKKSNTCSRPKMSNAEAPEKDPQTTVIYRVV